MTLLLIILDRQSYLLHNSPLPIKELADRLLEGDHSFAEWAASWLPDNLPGLLTYDGLLVIPAVDPGRDLHGELLSPPVASFSEHEAQVLEMMMDGLSFREIADRLQYSDRSIRNFTSSLRRKLGGVTLAQTVARAAARGYYRSSSKKRRA